MAYRMASHKVLKSVVRSVADSFTSLVNYVGDDYVMGHLLNAARHSGKTTLQINLLTGESGPKELLIKPVALSVKSYVQSFPDLVVRSGSAMSFICAAELRLSFDIGVAKPIRGIPHILESPYTCEVSIADDRGKAYSTTLSGWWYPEKVWKPSFWSHLRNCLAELSKMACSGPGR